MENSLISFYSIFPFHFQLLSGDSSGIITPLVQDTDFVSDSNMKDLVSALTELGRTDQDKEAEDKDVKDKDMKTKVDDEVSGRPCVQRSPLCLVFV